MLYYGVRKKKIEMEMNMNRQMRVLTVMVVSAMLFMVGCQSKETNNNNNNNENATETNVGAEDKTPGSSINQGLDLKYSEGLDEEGFFDGITAKELVDMIDFDSIEVPNYVHEIPDERVDEGIDYVLSNFKTTSEVMDRDVVNGDTINIDFVGSVDGVEFDGGNTDGAGAEVTIGVTSYIDDFLEQLIGHKPGDVVNVEVTFPETYHEESLKGKDALFVTKINFISQTNKPELTDEFVSENLSELYKVETADELREDFRANYRDEDVKNFIYSYLVENMAVSSVPDSVILYQQMLTGNMVFEEAYASNLSIEEYLQTQSDYANLDEFMEDSKEIFHTKGKNALIIQAIAEELDIRVSRDEIANYFLEFRGSDDYSDLEEKFGIPYIKKGVLADFVLDALAEIAVYE